MAEETRGFCARLRSGISEFTFANLYVDSLKYSYQVSRLSEATLAVTGISPERRLGGHDLGGAFFSVLGEMPGQEQLDGLFRRFRYWKNMPQELHDGFSARLLERGFQVLEDRDNFDYLYLRSDLAVLRGKAFHKKKNLVNAFLAEHSPEVRPLDVYTLPDAFSVLESWRAARKDDGQADYAQCRLALENSALLGMSGVVVYADGVPAGFSLGEFLCGGTMFVVMFEKGISSYKGIYQFVNRAQALSLATTVETINREQDLGNPGLRQAKTTYRPCGFTRKYLVLPGAL